MADAKVGPMALQCDKLQKEEGLDHYRQPSPYKKNIEAMAILVMWLQPTGTKKRGQTKSEKMSNKMKSSIVLFGIVLQQEKRRKRYAVRGVWPMDTPCVYRVGTGRLHMRDVCRRLSGITSRCEEAPTLASTFYKIINGYIYIYIKIV